MKGTVTKLCDIDSIAIPAALLDIQVDETRVDDALRMLSLRYAKESEAAAAEAGDLAVCKADAESYPDGRTILLFTGIAMPGAEDASRAVIGASVGETISTVLAEKPVKLTVQKILRRTPVEVNDALIAGIGLDGVQTVSDYRAYMRGKFLADLRMERSKEIMHYLLEQMVAGSEFSYDEAEMDAYVQKCMDEAAAAPLEFEDVDLSPDEVRASAIAQQKQDWIAEAFCISRGIEIDMHNVEAEADQMLEMMSLMGEPAPDRAEMIEMSLQNEYGNALFTHMDQIIAQKMGGSNGND